MPIPSTEKLTGIVQGFIPDRRYKALEYFAPETSENDKFGFDKITGSRGITTFRKAGGVAGVIATETRSRIMATLHTIREKKSLDESKLRWLDGPGKRDPEAASAWINRELADLNDIFDRTWNKLCFDLMRTGIMTITNEGVTEATYDFGLTQTGSAAVDWDTPATATPLADLRAAAETIRQNWGDDPSEILMPSQALEYLMATAEVQALLGESTKDEYAATGRVMKLLNMDVTIVDHGYRNSSGTFVPFLSSNGTLKNIVIIKAPGPVGQFVQGPAVDSKAPEGLIGKFAKVFSEEDPAGRWLLQTQTAMPGLTMPGKLYALTAWT